MTTRALWALNCALAVACIWWAEWPPLVDLPQHAAQIAMLLRWDDPSYASIQEDFRLNFATPYLVGYLAAWGLAHAVSVPTALKIILTAVVVGVPLTTRHLLRQVGGDPDLALLAWPVAMGFSYQYGFLNYLLGIPLAVVITSWASVEPERWRPRHGALLAAALVGLVLVHAIIAVVATGIAALIVVMRRWPRAGEAARAAAPLLAPIPILAAWILLTRSQEEQVATTTWSVDVMLLRPLSFLALLTGVEITPARMMLGVTLVGMPLWFGHTPSVRPWRWGLCLVPAALFLFLPRLFFGTFFVGERLTALVYLGWLAALDPPKPPHRARHLGFGLLAAAALLHGFYRVSCWDAEMAPVRQVLAQLPPNARAVSVVNRVQETLPAIFYYNVTSWHTVDQGGVIDFSFASYFPQLVRYRDGKSPGRATYDGDRAVLVIPSGDTPWSWVLLHEDRALTAIEPERAWFEVARHGKWALYRLAPP